ncbi:MAG: hypothetical protein A2026_00775 [Deltaproteobacteria bacterium RBG_19FT_COMBO_46_12]|nr:MAG: hypothetical protein A2026_00775 [Deltaproteobacteria bacterium RBG_19FT_COMBO_46_12]
MKPHGKWQQFSSDGALNSKHEIPAFAEAASRRQAKFETNSNDQNSNFYTEESNMFGKFDNLNLGFVSKFDIRISDFFDGVFGSRYTRF